MITLLKLAWVFLKIGAFSFGGGLVIIPLVQQDVVTNYGWLTQEEFVDAVTLSQITPGPIVISATFIGYKVSGILGAIVATTSVILPSFVMICLATEAIKRFRKNKVLAGFFRGARIAVIAMILDVGIRMGINSLVDVRTFVIAGVSILVLFKYKVNPIWILIGAGIIGVLS